MLDLVGRSPAATHEDVFLARYRALVLTALRVTDGNRAEAEDLVHEAFIRFTLVQPPLDEVQHLDAYLSRMLRNMYTSRIRRRQRAAETSLSILDYDSLDIGFHAMDASGQLEVREMLRAACEYGCIRKRSSKAGSVFLLRFFHGYLPSEIASLARLSSGIVDALVFRARREVKGYVENPDQLTFIDRTGPRAVNAPAGRVERPVTSGDGRSPGPATPGIDRPERAFVDELRARIFNDTHDRCWSKKTLRDMYGNPSAEALSRDDLADLVGCSTCLDAASALLGLPRLADRWPVDTLGPGSRGGPGGGTTPGTITSGRRRARAVFEHRPRQLRVSVNGFILGSHTIGADASELTLSVNLNEPIASVELLSEQGLCLVFLDTSPPPDGNARQRRRVDLRDGRHAQIEVEFAGPWPTVRASYSDPRPRLSAHTEDELAGEIQDATQAQLVLEMPRWPRRLFGSRPAWMTALVAITIWLLFWTPGASVSAAERIADAIRWLVSAVFQSDSPGATREVAPPAPNARDISLPLVTTIPVRPAGMDGARRTSLELKALVELQRVNAYLGQELSFASADGTTVQVRGLVDTNARKLALLGALGPLLSDSDLQARITNVNEIANRPRQPSRTESEARTFAFTRDQFPMFVGVRRYVLSQQQRQHEDSGASGPLVVDDSDVDARTQRFAMQILDRSRRASQHAWALKHLSDRFPAEVISAASPDTRELWQTVVSEHARAYGQEIALLRRDLEPAIRMLNEDVAGGEVADTDSSIDDGGHTWARITRLHDAHRRQDQAIQDAFAIQSGSKDDVDGVQTAAFWTLMDACEALAEGLTDPSR